MSMSIEEIAVHIAPCLKDKFDLSGGSNWGHSGDLSGMDQWVAMSFQAAAAFKAKADSLAPKKEAK